MDKYFSKILRGYISKQKQRNLSAFSAQELPFKTKFESCNVNFTGPGNGWGGVYFLNKLLFTITGPNGGGGAYKIPNFKK